ncbi:hypothetical protein NPIL_20241 [Nephila pilipes]|uniref:Uncharacterized protein n=1 Tax=Nephila pilipes TaxID=299642 RepID=A0A8X6TJB6_NEPPI|nr:hypothetical protein NPIL_20241 [Nephila pilipes]
MTPAPFRPHGNEGFCPSRTDSGFNQWEKGKLSDGHKGRVSCMTTLNLKKAITGSEDHEEEDVREMLSVVAER